MTHRSKRDLARAVDGLERKHVTAGEYDRDPLAPEAKHTLADVLDADPWDRTDTRARDLLDDLHREDT